MLAVIVTLGGLIVRAATKAVDLDGNGTAESSVTLNVLSTYPAKIENVVTNKSVGNTFTFKWANAGPGSWNGTLAAGTSTGVGTKWTWQTSSAIYSITGSNCTNDICFTTSTGASRGPFVVPGRSLSTSGVTLSNASLTASLVTFFSPPKVLFSATSSSQQGGSGQVNYNTTLTNNTAGAVTAHLDAGPPGCCPFPNQLNCSGTCVNYLSDESNCGGCGIHCDTLHGQFCDNGACIASCPIGQTLCGADCVDLTSDPLNCGSCGHACGTNQICANSACFTCTPPQQTACNNQCVNIHTDALNCGGCGVNCNAQCPSTGQGACSQGNSCFCVGGAGTNSSNFLAAPEVLITLPPPAPVCETQAATQTVPSGQSASLSCNSASYLAKEVLSFVHVCLDGSTPNPTTDLCLDGSSAFVGPFLQLAPDTGHPANGTIAALLSPIAVSIQDTSGDGLWQPGETVKVNVSVGNTGYANLIGGCATISSPAQDLTPNDGINNPTTVSIATATACYPDIPGTPGTTGNCSTPPAVTPKLGNSSFVLSTAPGYLGDTSRIFVLHFTGSANGNPVSEDVPLTLGIGSKCDPTNIQNGFDGFVGLYSPMAAAIPEDDPRSLPTPPKPFALGKTRPLKLTFSCSGLNLDATNALAPKIVELFDLTTNQAVDLTKININDSPNQFDPEFRYQSSLGGWIYQMRTKDLAAHKYRMKFVIAGARIFKTGFELVN
jgi:hypothetical protein